MAPAGAAPPEAPDGASPARGRAILAVDGITKNFPGLCALDRVSLAVHAHEIVALLGQNGSGKSTLVKILAGVYTADGGAIAIGGAGAQTGPGQRHLHFIHQDLGLIHDLSTVENLALGDGDAAAGPRGLAPVRRRTERRRAEQLIARFGIHFDVTAPVGGLTPAQRTIVAIARAMDGWSPGDNVLILDEPTAALQGEEVALLFAAVRRVADSGAGVVFISHRLEEVTELADRVVVLRDGRLVADRTARGLDSNQLAGLITGREPVLTSDRGLDAAPTTGQPVLAARGVTGGALRPLDLDLWPGEVVGVAGSIGSGRDLLPGLLFGSHPRAGGAVTVNGRPVRPGSPHAALRRGVALVPADRHAHGGVMTHSVRENIALPLLGPLTVGGFHLRRAAERRGVDSWCDKVDLRPRSPERPLGLFSGGNQQKAVIARWLRTRPHVLLVEEPTQGVDVGASESIRQLILAAAADGMAVLVASSDNADLIRMCSRVLVLRAGAVACELRGSAINDHRLTQECLGMSADEVMHISEREQEASHV